MLQLLKNININFMKNRRWAFVVSAILIASGFFAIYEMMTNRANMGVDFAGGTSIEVDFDKQIEPEKLREALTIPEFQSVSQQFISEPGRSKYMLRVMAPELPTEQVSGRVMEVLKQAFKDNKIELLASEDVGPSVSAHLRQQALYAVFWAMVMIILYIWWRFDFRYSVAATIATFHDVLAILGIFVIMDYEISWILITALLTVAGYSLNDTIVVFDRIRENLRHRRKEEYKKVVNSSINETLTRTIITSLTTLFVVLSLLILGGEVIHTFSLAMLLGIVIGTYSSIFVASNILVEWFERDPLPR